MKLHNHTKALVVLNPAAGGGRGLERWLTVEPLVNQKYDIRVVQTDTNGQWELSLRKAVASNVRLFIAAGGDGTVHALLNSLVQTVSREEMHTFTLGAVGLGSSNDFHKPLKCMAGDIPLRIGSSRMLHDIGQASLSADLSDFIRMKKHFLISASLGLVAEANAFFSGDNTTQKWLRSRSTSAAITHAALRTLLSYQNISALLRYPDQPEKSISLTNLSITKSQWLSGSFRYDTSVSANDGLFSVQLCEGMNRLEAFRTMLNLSKGRFIGPAKRSSTKIPTLEVELDKTVILELDGELYQTKKVLFKILKERIGICA